MNLKERIKTELDEIMLAHGGLLNPSHVVEHARDPGTTLHSQFVWDDSDAADKYRLWQARQIISNYHVVCTTPKGQVVQVSAYVSLPEDRKSGGGYRAIGEVLSMPEHRRQLFAQAVAEFKQWRVKYSSLMRLQPVFKAFDAMRARTERKATHKKARGKVAAGSKARRAASMA